MAIEFHCDHCNKIIRAPDEVGGRQGRCPHCGGLTYIPSGAAAEGELDLAPLDDADEERRRRATMEDAAYQQKILHERALPGEPSGQGGRGGKGHSVTAQAAPTTKQLTSLIVQYVEAMSGGKLPVASELAGKLARHRALALGLLDEMAGEDLSAYGMPQLPRPVLQGFLKQLRTSL